MAKVDYKNAPTSKNDWIVFLSLDCKMADNEQKAIQLCSEAEKKLNAKPFLGKQVLRDTIDI